MSFLWYWPAGPAGGWDFDAWKRKQAAAEWSPGDITASEQAGQKEPVTLVPPGMTLAQWQRKAGDWRKISDQILGPLSDGPPTQLRSEKLGIPFRTERYTMQRWRYSLTDDEWGYAWLLTPQERKFPGSAVLALHQTSCMGKNEPVGIDFTPDERHGVYYAHEMANLGHVVFVPDAIAFGERQSGHRNAKYHSADEFFAAQPHGSVMGKMGFDTSRAVDFLQQLPELAIKKVACVGHSHGAYGTLFAMLADPRITCGVMSCGVSCLRDDPSPDRWWRKTALIPRLGFYENKIDQTPIDFHIWVALLAPRPVMIIAGTQDTIFPNQAVLPGRLELAKKVYELHGAKDAITWDIADSPHSFRDDARPKAYAMIESALISSPSGRG